MAHAPDYLVVITGLSGSGKSNVQSTLVQFIPRVDAGSPVTPRESQPTGAVTAGITGDPASSRGIN